MKRLLTVVLIVLLLFGHFRNDTGQYFRTGSNGGAGNGCNAGA